MLEKEFCSGSCQGGYGGYRVHAKGLGSPLSTPQSQTSHASLEISCSGDPEPLPQLDRHSTTELQPLGLVLFLQLDA